MYISTSSCDGKVDFWNCPNDVYNLTMEQTKVDGEDWSPIRYYTNLRKYHKFDNESDLDVFEDCIQIDIAAKEYGVSVEKILLEFYDNLKKVRHHVRDILKMPLYMMAYWFY